MKRGGSIFAATLAALIVVRVAAMLVAPVFEPSEARYAAISANMARTGDWFVPSFTYKGVYQPFAGKPPFAFQASALSCKALGVSEFAVRLPSLVSWLALLAILYWSVRRTSSRDAAMLAVGLCATTVSLYMMSGICMTDALLVCCVSGALLLYATRDTSLYPAVALLLALGTVVKGPVALALFGLPALADSVIARRLPPLPLKRTLLSLFLLVAVVVSYFAAVEANQPGFLRYFIVNENIMRFLVHDYGDKYGAGRETFRGMAVVWTLVATLPWSLVPFFRRRLPSLSFHTLSILCITLFWCLTSRVPFTYLLPVAPLFAAHLATRPEEFGIEPTRLRRLVPFAAALACVVLCGALSYTYAFNRKKMPGASAPMKVSDHYFSYEFYNGPWGEGAPK